MSIIEAVYDSATKRLRVDLLVSMVGAIAKRTYTDRPAAAEAIAIGDLVLGDAFAVEGQGQFTLDGTGTAFDDQSSGLGVSAVAEAPQRITPELFGAAADGVTDDEAEFLRAAGVADTKPLRLTRRAYYLASSRPRFQDTFDGGFMQEAGGHLTADLSPSIKEIPLHTPLKTSHPTLSTRDHTFMANTNVPWPLGQMSALIADATPYILTRGDFTSGWTDRRIDSANNATASSATVTASQVSWASDAPSGIEGIYRVFEQGEHWRVTFLRDDTSEGTASSYYVGVDVRFTTSATARTVRLNFRQDDTGARVWYYDGGGTGSSAAFDLPKTTQTINTNGALTLGARLVGETTVEVYANDLLVYSWDLADLYGATDIDEIGFSISRQMTAQTKILYPVRVDSKWVPKSKRAVSIALIGDSITYGAWASIDYGQFLSPMLKSSPYFGDVSVENFGVSGATAATWVAGGSYSGDGPAQAYGPIADEDFTGYDYVLVQLGTNEANSGLSRTTYITNIETIGDKIVADGAIPIFGVFPRATETYAPSDDYAEYVGALEWACAGKGWTLANNRAAYGLVNEFFDSLHPTELGQVHLAGGFASAILTHEYTGAYPMPSRHFAEYAISGDTTARALAAVDLSALEAVDLSTLTVSASPTQAEVEAIRDGVEAALQAQATGVEAALQDVADVLATLARDLAAAGAVKV